MKIAFNVNDAYVEQLGTCILSILEQHPSEFIEFFVFSSDFSLESQNQINKLKVWYKNWEINYLSPDPALFKDLQLNVAHISRETYYRFVIADMLAQEDKILYLDADLIVKKSLLPLWHTDISRYDLAGVEDIWIQKHASYRETLQIAADAPYINAGVMLLNLKRWRENKLSAACFQAGKRFHGVIKWQDQDIINIVCSNHILLLDKKWNFTRQDIEATPSQAETAHIIHYTTSDKPWLHRYRVKLFSRKRKAKKMYFPFWRKYKKLQQKKLYGAIVVNEFFGAWNTAYGGYGFLARKYLADRLPAADMRIDVILPCGENRFFPQWQRVEKTRLIRLPRKKWFSKLWLRLFHYDFYLTIEITDDWVFKTAPHLHKKKILFWIQDPRPQSDWDEINTVKLCTEKCYFAPHTNKLVGKLAKEGAVSFITQAHCLERKARDLYGLPAGQPIWYCPNPVYIPPVDWPQKKNHIIFLGRVEDVKRGWLFCETAKRCPEYEFFVLGASWKDKSKNAEVLAPYRSLPNLHFEGHVDGEKKARYLKDAKILLNTSIHEALPVSFLEALSYGMALVSNQNPDELTSRFGVWTGPILGDGFDKVDLYAEAVKKLMMDESLRSSLAEKGREYVRAVHAIPVSIGKLKKFIYQEIDYK